MLFERLTFRSKKEISPLLPPDHVHPEALPEHENAKEQQARSLCQIGDYGEILERFGQPEHKNLLERQTVRLKLKYAERLKHASEHLQDHDWEMLTILELFDRATFEHCLRTYETAHQKIGSSGPVGAYLREHIAAEGLTPWDIELACLLHDMGKIILSPKDKLLNNTLKDAEWHKLFEHFCRNSFPQEIAEEKITLYNQDVDRAPDHREMKVTPLTVSLTPEERVELERHGIDTNLPLGTIIDKHQDISVEIVRRYYADHPALLDLIGNHHERPLPTDEPVPVSQSTVRLSFIVDALRLSDLYDAMRSARPYKESRPLLTTLAFLIGKAEEGFVDMELTRLWIEDELSRLDTAAYLHQLHRNELLGLETTETAAWQKIQSFLALPEPLKQAA